MSHILKALRKSQMERELGEIPSIKVSYPNEPPRAPRAPRWPWVMAAAVAGIAVTSAISLWLLAATNENPGHGEVGATGAPSSAPTSTVNTPAIPAQELGSNSAAASVQGQGEEATDLTILTKALPLVPKGTEGGAAASAPPPASAPQGFAEKPAPDLARPLTAEQLPEAEKAPGDAAERHGYPVVAAVDNVPRADPGPSSIRPEENSIAALSPATARIAIPEGQAGLPPEPRRRPAEAIWVATISAARAARAAQDAAQNPAPLPPLSGGTDVAQLPAFPPRDRSDRDRAALADPAPSSAEAAGTEAAIGQEAYMPPRLDATLGAVVGQNGEGTLAERADSALPRYEQLSQALRSKIPPVRLSAQVYDPDPQRRFARINKKKVREGEEIAPGLLLEAVTEDGIVLRYDDIRFRMSNF